MIKNISELREKRIEYIQRFLKECTVTEKIDTYYVTVEVISKNNIIFKKSNGKVIDRTDMILNSMWDRLLNDWNYFRMVNNEWFEKHIGYKIHMFFFPCKSPIYTEYKDNVSYVIDRVMFGKEYFKPESVMWNMQMLDKFNIHFIDTMKKKEFDVNEIAEKIHKSTDTVSDIFLSEVIDIEHSNVFANNLPEGYIIRCGKNAYQIIYDNEIERFVKSEKSQYEYILRDFVKYWNEDKLWTMLDTSYIKTVCILFNSYIMNREKQTDEMKNNIDSDSIKNPYVGYRFDINYNYIPDEMTIALCKENELYSNIFKILIVNLKQFKKSSNCVLIDSRVVDDWNNIVKNITTRCLFD